MILLSSHIKSPESPFFEQGGNISCDSFLLPSDHQQLSIVQIEAQLFSCRPCSPPRTSAARQKNRQRMRIDISEFCTFRKTVQKMIHATLLSTGKKFWSCWLFEWHRYINIKFIFSEGIYLGKLFAWVYPKLPVPIFQVYFDELIDFCYDFGSFHKRNVLYRRVD